MIPLGTCRVCGCACSPRFTLCVQCHKAERLVDAWRKIRIASQEGMVLDGFERFTTPPEYLTNLNIDHWKWAKQNERINVLAHGAIGTGKSSLCRYLLCRDIIKDKIVYDVCATQIEQWRFSPWEHAEKLAWAKGRDTVLIDDLDNVNWTPGGVNILREILDTRHETHRRTLVTCNCNPVELKAKLASVTSETTAQSLLERLRPYHAMKFSGESFRKSL